MDDFGPLTQSIISFIGGLGLTGLVVTIYEARVRRKERSVDRFCELVLTPVLFRFLSVSYEIIRLFEAYDRVKRGESPTLSLDGAVVEVPNLEDWNRRIEDLGIELGVLTKKAADTGIVTLAPKKIGNELSELGTTLNEMRRKAMAEEDLSAIVKKGRVQWRQISVDIRKIVGTYELGRE